MVGVPVLATTLLVARGFADVERRWLPEVLGRPVARPRYRPAPESAGWFRRMVNPLTNGQSWLDLLYGIVAFPFSDRHLRPHGGLVGRAIAGLTYPLYGWILADPRQRRELPELLGLGGSMWVEVVFNTRHRRALRRHPAR